MDCDFCKKVFGSKTALEHHKKTAKYCLEIQGTSPQIFECVYCKKHLSTKERLSMHNSICKHKKQKENIEKEKHVEKSFNEQKMYYENILKEKDDYHIGILKEKDDYHIGILKEKEDNHLGILKEKNDYIAKLEAKLEKFEDSILSKSDKKPYTTNNTTTNIVINNSLNLNDIEKMNSFLDEKLDKEVLAGGQKSFALLMSSTMLKDKYKCVDPSRQNFEFTNELGEIERDVKAKKLTNAIIKSNIRSRSGEKGEELWKKEDGSTDSLRFQANSKNVIDMINFDIDNSTFRSELTALTT